MINNTETNLFRLAAVLYADNNYEVSSKTTIKKVIEAAILENGNKSITVHELISFIDTNFHLQLDQAEIKHIIKSNEESFIFNDRLDDTYVYLSENRKKNLDAKLTGKTIDFFIDEFLSISDLDDNLTNAKEVIYKFLYDILNSNIEGFRKLIDNQGHVTEIFNLDYHDYKPKEKELINEFLRWENNDKNVAVFNIASYALEYCLLCNNGSGLNIQLSNLRNKTFYLDTNVIFRTLGLNGANRKERSVQFLKKFQELNAQLVISKFTDAEFKRTVKFYVDKLKRVPLYSILNPRIFDERYFNRKDEFNDFYYKWRAGKVNDSLELFEGHILSFYESFKKEFNITVDHVIPFDENDQEIETKIGSISADIGAHKNKEDISHGSNGDYNDALNIMLLEYRRDGKFSNIFETKFFILSTDQSLRRWDYHRNSTTPVVVLPSQWMSIILRYVNRTSDDYKSFVSFLNLPNQESMVSSDRLHLVLSGISEMTSNFDQQHNLVHTLVQTKFEGILEVGISDEQVLQNVKDFVSSELSTKVEELQNSHEAVVEKFTEHRNSTSKEIEDLKGVVTAKDETLSKTSDVNQLLTRHIVEIKLKLWRQWAKFFFAPFFILSIIFFILLILFVNSDWNPVAILLKLIDRDTNETRKSIYETMFYGIPVALFTYTATVCYKRLISEEAKIEKEEKIKRLIDHKQIH